MQVTDGAYLFPSIEFVKFSVVRNKQHNIFFFSKKIEYCCFFKKISLQLPIRH